MSRIINKQELIDNSGYKQENLDADEARLNVMHTFRTYAYHHILIVANTTAAADAAMNSKDLESWLHESYDKKYEPKTPPGMSEGKDAYMVLINGLTDAEFMIQSVELETIIDPSARTSNPHASFVEGTMEIVEPKGVRFMNLLKDACDKLKSEPNGLTFIMKTIFVGYTDSSMGQPKIQQIIDTRPFQFFIMDLTGEFTAAGSTYQIQFVGNINGTPRLPIFSKLQQSNVSGGNVRDALTSLEKQLNDAAKEGYEKLVKQLDESNNSKAKDDASKYSPKGRRVKYVIQVADEFASLPLDNVHPRNQGSGGNANLSTPQGIDVETAITDVLLSTTKLSDVMNKHVLEGYKTIFKIDSTLETTLEEAIVTFAVKACKVPVMFKDNRNHQGDENIIEPDITSRYVIEFDYLFTGKNVEVLEYDMKMAMGVAFFQSFGSTNNLPGGFHGASGDVTFLGSGSGTVLNSKNTVMRQYSIVPAPATIQDPASRNKTESAKTADFRTFMARQAAFESITSKIRIAGIPWLLEAFNQHEIDQSKPSGQSLKEKLPLIKVNVRMPARDSEFIKGTKDYTEDFWYTGFFQIMSCKSIFRDGRFEQEMDLNSLLYEEMVAPEGAGAAPARRLGDPNTTSSSTPDGKGNKTDKSKTSTPVETAEQKAKLGVKSVPLSPEEKLNCQSIRKQPITMASARRTYLSKSITLEHLIRREINIPHLTDRILNNLCALAKKLEEVQQVLGHSITITSGFRCPAYNAGTKGSSKTSDHMQGVAADFVCPAYGPPEKIFNALKASGLDFRQVISETSSSASWIHVSFNIDSTLTPIAASNKFMHMRV